MSGLEAIMEAEMDRLAAAHPDPAPFEALRSCLWHYHRSRP